MMYLIPIALLSIIATATIESAPIHYVKEPVAIQVFDVYEDMEEVEVPEAPAVEIIQRDAIRDLIQTTFYDAPIMWRVAECESESRQFSASGDVLQGYVNPSDTGVFQINKYYHLDTAQSLGLDLDTPEGNIAYARILYDRNGTRDWDASRYCWE